jgi:DnaK suppressor protein
MKQQVLQEFKTALEAQRTELHKAAVSLDEASKPVKLDQAMVGRLSRMDAMQGQQMAMAAARRNELQLVKIAASLKRIAADDYGYCFVCEEEIDIRRLHADPTATRCIQCVAS